jgi:hypothetical protein
VFVEQENIVYTLEWPSVIAKNKKIFVLRRKTFGRIASKANLTKKIDRIKAVPQIETVFYQFVSFLFILDLDQAFA